MQAIVWGVVYPNNVFYMIEWDILIYEIKSQLDIHVYILHCIDTYH